MYDLPVPLLETSSGPNAVLVSCDSPSRAGAFCTSPEEGRRVADEGFGSWLGRQNKARALNKSKVEGLEACQDPLWQPVMFSDQWRKRGTVWLPTCQGAAHQPLLRERPQDQEPVGRASDLALAA